LTTLNSNVLYELGLAHGLRVPTVLLTQSLGEVPFDLRSYRIIPYSTQFDQVGNLTKALGDVAAAHRVGTITFGSPIIDFYTVEGGTVPHREVATREEEEATPAEGDVDEEPPGFLEAQVEAMDASERLIALFEAFGLEAQRLSAEFEANLPAVEETAASTDPGAARRMLVLGHELSQVLLRYGEGLDEHLPEFEEQ